MSVVPGVNTDVGGGLSPIPANTALGNFTGAVALPIAQTKSAWITWLDVPTNSDPRLSDARDWFASSVSQAEAEAGTEVVDRKWSALRVRQSTRVNPDFDPTGNLFTIGTSTNAQRLRLRRRFSGAGDFSQLSIDFSGDNCRILTQHAGNNPNPLNLGTAGVERLFIAADATRVGIGGAPTTRPLEIFAGTAGFRLQSSSAVSPPVYTEIARTFDFLTWQDSTSPFNTFTDLVANSNQFNNHSVRLFVHTSGTSAPVLHSVFHSSGRLLVGTDVDNGTDRLQVNGNVTASNAISALVLSATSVRTGILADSAGNVVANIVNNVGIPRLRATVAASYNATAANSIWCTNAAEDFTRVGINQNDDGTVILHQLGSLGWAANLADVRTQAIGLGLDRANATTVEINNGTAGTLRDLSLRNITASGSLTLGGATDVLIPSAASTRETIFRARVSDAGNDAFHIYNATGFDGSFVSGFSGSQFSGRAALVFVGQTTAANDTGTTPLIAFEARRTNSETDPNNGTYSPITTRPLFQWWNNPTALMTMFANGNLALNSTTNNGARLQVNGPVNTGTLDSSTPTSVTIFTTGDVLNPDGFYFDRTFFGQRQRHGLSTRYSSASAGIALWALGNAIAGGVGSGFFVSSLGLGFSSGSALSVNPDAFISRTSAGSLRIGTTNSGNDGTLQLANLTASGFITSAFQSLSADPSTIDIPSGSNRIVKNTTSGEVRDWVNDGGIMKKSPAYT